MAQDSQNIASLFDFIYLDSDKLGSISAQIFDDGLLVTTKKVNNTNKSSTQSSTAKTDASGEVKASLFSSGGKIGGKFEVAGSTSNTGGLSTGAEFMYDASYSAPINLLNKLDELGYIKRGLEYGYGSIVLISGKIRLSDIGLVSDLWVPTTERFFKSVVGDRTRNKAEVNEAKNNLQGLGNLKPVIDAFAKHINCHIDTSGGKAWSNLKREFLRIDPADFILKNSQNIPGEWYCLAIIDSKPEDVDFEYREGESETSINLALQEARNFFSVDDNAYGITPIAIFRSIK